MGRTLAKAENLFRLSLFLVIVFLALLHLHTRAQLRDEKAQAAHQARQRLALLADLASEGLPAAVGPGPLNALETRLRVREVALIEPERLQAAGLSPQQVRSLQAGQRVFPPAYADESDGAVQAVFTPLPDDGPGPRVLKIAIALREAESGGTNASTGFLLKLFGGVGIVVLFYYGMRSAVLSHRGRAPSKALGAEEAPPEGGQDSESFVIGTFQSLIQQLKEKEEALARLKKVAEERADHMESYNENILRSVSSGVITFNEEAVVTTFNQAAERILDIPAAGAIGRGCDEVFAGNPAIRQLVRDALLRKETTARQEIEIRCPAAQGGSEAVRRIWAGVSTSLLLDKGDQVIGTTLVFSDLTEIKQLQEQVELKKRLMLLGEVSAGIAHEFRNYMGTIMGYAKLLSKKVGPEHASAGMIQAITQELQEMEKLIQELLSFSRQPVLNRRAVNLNALLSKTARQVLKQAPSPRPKLILDLYPDLKPVPLDEILIRQALGNILKNAQEAMPQGGELILRTRPVPAPAAKQGEGDTGQGTEGGVEVEVRDTGVGMSRETQARIFTPLFTTKEKGTGMGMALAHKIILSHQGRIQVDSREGRGSTFRVYLPITGKSV